MNEIKLGDVPVIRVEGTPGPIMPTGVFFPSIPAQSWRDHKDVLEPDHLGDDDMVHVAPVEVAPGESARIYSPGRTVVDLMRMRHKLGESVAHVALRRYLTRRDALVADLMAYAKASDVYRDILIEMADSSGGGVLSRHAPSTIAATMRTISSWTWPRRSVPS